MTSWTSVLCLTHKPTVTRRTTQGWQFNLMSILTQKLIIITCIFQGGFLQCSKLNISFKTKISANNILTEVCKDAHLFLSLQFFLSMMLHFTYEKTNI